MEENNQVTSEENTTQENTEVTNEESQEEISVEDKRDEVAKLNAIIERKTKKVKELNSESETKTQKESNLQDKPTSVSMEDVFVVSSNQLSSEEYNYAQKVAELNETTLQEAVKDDLFKSWREKQKEETKKQQAEMGASKGSKGMKEKKSFDSKGLSQEEHKALFKEKMGI